MDIFKLALFPFVNKASEYVKSLNFSIDEIFYDPAFQGVRERGKQRVIEAIQDKIKKPRISDITGAEKELLSYPVARILVSCVNDGYLIRKYALAEAESAHDLLKNPDFFETKEEFNNFLKELTDDFGIEVVLDKTIALHFTDYIRYATGIGPEWKLINSRIRKGMVYLTKDKFLRLLQEAFRKRVMSNLPLDVPSKLHTLLETHVAEIRSQLEVRKHTIEEFGEIMQDCFPPCILHALSDIKAGVNLPHSRRFALTSFLLNIGMNVEKVMQIFRVSPDFDEERTRYQVMHIHGSTGTVYTSPSCSTMLTYGNCIGKDELCRQISHPLSYYKRKASRSKTGQKRYISE